MLDQFRERSHGVVDVAEAARLRAVAEDRQRLPASAARTKLGSTMP